MDFAATELRDRVYYKIYFKRLHYFQSSIRRPPPPLLRTTKCHYFLSSLVGLLLENYCIETKNYSANTLHYTE